MKSSNQWKVSKSMKTSSDMLVISIIPTTTMFCVGVEMRGLNPIFNQHFFNKWIYQPIRTPPFTKIKKPESANGRIQKWPYVYFAHSLVRTDRLNKIGGPTSYHSGRAFQNSTNVRHSVKIFASSGSPSVNEIFALTKCSKFVPISDILCEISDSFQI